MASQLFPYSIGIAVENKPLDSRHLNVAPIEQLSALDGELTFNPVEHIVKGQLPDGGSYETKIITDVSITAEWLPMGSNRVTPPDIRRGELVEIYRLADTDKFFWRPLGIRDHLRRLETVIWAFNGSPDENTVGIDPSTCYFVEVSTHQKQITISTSKANGEPFAYSFQINAADGKVVLEDDAGNFIELDSANTLLHLENAEGTMLELNQRDIKAHAPNNFTAAIGNDANLQVGNNFTLQAGGDVNLSASGDVNLSAGGGINQTAGQAVTISAGTEATLEAGANISANAGANFTVNAAGTAMVSGGAGAMLASGGQSIGIGAGGATVTVSRIDIKRG